MKLSKKKNSSQKSEIYNNEILDNESMNNESSTEMDEVVEPDVSPLQDEKTLTRKEKRALEKEKRALENENRRKEKEERKSKRKEEKSLRHLKKATQHERQVFAFFTATLILAAVFFWIWPKQEKSEIEKRTLAQQPEFSLQSILSGEFSAGYEAFYADQFPFRNAFISLHRTIEKLYTATPWVKKEDSIEIITGNKDDGGQGEQITLTPTESVEETTTETTVKEITQETTASSTVDETAKTEETTSETTKATTKPSETTGTTKKEDLQVHDLSTLIIYKGRAMEIYYYVEAAGQAYADRINLLRELLPKDRTLINMIVPSAMGIYGTEELRSGPNNQKDAIADMYSRMDDSVVTVDAYSELWDHQDEYLFFRTDHHWNGRGAYYGYKAFSEAMDQEYTALEDMELTQPKDTFFGSLYGFSNESPLLKDSADRAEIFIPKHTGRNFYYSGAAMDDGAENILLNAHVPQGNQYLLYTGGDAAVNYIHSENTNGKSIVVIKESFANAFLPYLMDNYEHIYAVDPRRFEDKLIPFIVENDIQDVMVLNYSFGTSNPTWIEGYDAMLE